MSIKVMKCLLKPCAFALFITLISGLVIPSAQAKDNSQLVTKTNAPKVEHTPRPHSKVFTSHQKALVAKAEKTFNAITSMTARFNQAASTGEFSTGKVYLSKPGRLRIEYDPPIPVLVVANNDYFTFIDREMDQRSYLSLDATPAGVLLRKNVSLTKDDIRVVDVQEQPGIVNIIVTSKSDPTIGRLSLVFSAKPFAFRQWQVTDAQGITTTVTLQDIKTGISLNSSLFAAPEPNS